MLESNSPENEQTNEVEADTPVLMQTEQTNADDNDTTAGGEPMFPAIDEVKYSTGSFCLVITVYPIPSF